MNKPMIAGVEQALKMREMFQADGYRVSTYIGESFNLSQRPNTVAVLFISNGAFFRGYYFYEDGTYFTGIN